MLCLKDAIVFLFRRCSTIKTGSHKEIREYGSVHKRRSVTKWRRNWAINCSKYGENIQNVILKKHGLCSIISKSVVYKLINSHGKMLFVHMLDIVDTTFSYGRELIVCLFLQESSKVKESSLYEIWNADTAFLVTCSYFIYLTRSQLTMNYSNFVWSIHLNHSRLYLIQISDSFFPMFHHIIYSTPKSCCHFSIVIASIIDISGRKYIVYCSFQ